MPEIGSRLKRLHGNARRLTQWLKTICSSVDGPDSPHLNLLMASFPSR